MQSLILQPLGDTEGCEQGNCDTQTHEVQSPIRTGWRPHLESLLCPWPRAALGPPCRSTRHHCARAGACVCSRVPQRRAGASEGCRQPAARRTHRGGAEARGRRDALPHRLQRGAGSLSLLAKGASPSPDALTPDPNSRGFKNQPRPRQARRACGQKSGGADGAPRGLGSRSHPKSGNSSPGIRGSSPRRPAPRTADRLLMSGVCDRWNGGPQHVSKNGGLECSQERDW